MSATGAAQRLTLEKLGLPENGLVQEFGYDDDVDFELRDSLEDLLGSELLDEDDQEIVDGVLLWWRSDDGDLVDGLMDVLASIDDGGVIWLLTPKSGRQGYVSPADILQAAPLAGLRVTTTESLASEWSATRLITQQNK